MILWPLSRSATKIGAGVVQSFQCPWIPTFWSWLHWHFRVRKRSQPKKHIWYLSVSSETYSTQAFFGDDSIGLSQSCTGIANDMNPAKSRRTMQGVATKKECAAWPFLVETVKLEIGYHVKIPAKIFVSSKKRESSEMSQDDSTDPLSDSTTVPSLKLT